MGLSHISIGCCTTSPVPREWRRFKTSSRSIGGIGIARWVRGGSLVGVAACSGVDQGSVSILPMSFRFLNPHFVTLQVGYSSQLLSYRPALKRPVRLRCSPKPQVASRAVQAESPAAAGAPAGGFEMTVVAG